MLYRIDLSPSKEESISNITEINKKIIDHQTSLPVYFIKEFDILNITQVQRLRPYDKLSLYKKSLSHINFDEIRFVLHYNNFLENREQLFSKILEHFKDIVCAQKYFKNVGKENDRYCLARSQNKNSLLA